MSADRLEIAVRAYSEPANRGERSTGRGSSHGPLPSAWTLIFDCETKVDAGQSLRVAAYQLREFGELRYQGLFYDPEAIEEDELELLKSYASRHGLDLHTRDAFVEDIFYCAAYENDATVVGFNLPFDLSRIATAHGVARKDMLGGFSLKLSCDKQRPRVRIRHLSRTAAIIKFARPARQESSRGQRKRGIFTPPHPGFFVDVKTIASAILSAGGSLGDLCELLQTPTRKRATDEHGGPLTVEYLDYLQTDVQATWECYKELVRRYDTFGLDKPAHKVLSEASLGKAILDALGIRSHRECQPDFPRRLTGQIMSAYFGGRAEVNIRREITRVIHTDFKSMYPTVNTLMGLWDFVIADGVTWRDATEATRELLDRIARDDLKRPETWRELRTLVRVKPDRDRLPTRAKYDGKVWTIGLNQLTCDQPLWFSLADCVAAKLLTGRAPDVLEAIQFEPGAPQNTLMPFVLMGDPRFAIDPSRVDAFKRLVDLRDRAKAEGGDNELALKIITNAMSYGIFIEIIRKSISEPEKLRVYGPDGIPRWVETTAIEEPGRIFHPLLGVLITGAARLMLALGETLVLDEGLDWVFCDTDSLAIAKPRTMAEDEFRDRADRVVAWFEALNPYEKASSILKKEDVNFDPETGEMVELFAFAISSKRYALFSVDAEGRPVIRKASAHGLGHLIAPYGYNEAPSEIPKPIGDVSEIGVSRWQYDLWFKIIEAARAEHPEQVELDYHPALKHPAASRYAATSPRLLDWFKPWNQDRPYSDQVKPFNFLISFMIRDGLRGRCEVDEPEMPKKRGRRKKKQPVMPVAPYDRAPSRAASDAYDRVTGEPVSLEHLMTYAEALCDYHLSTEDKFANAEAWDRGMTQRRHVVATAVRLIGKEAIRLDEQMPANVDRKDVSEFGQIC